MNSNGALNSDWMRLFDRAWSTSVTNGVTDPALHLAPRETIDGPRVSIIMPTFRRSHQIAESIRSLQNGEYQDFELLVCDDGNASDGTEEAVAGTSNPASTI